MHYHSQIKFHPSPIVGLLLVLLRKLLTAVSRKFFGLLSLAVDVDQSAKNLLFG